MRKLLFTAAMLLATTVFVSAQNDQHPILFSFGLDALDYVTPTGDDGVFKGDNTHFAMPVSFIQAGYAVNNSVTVGLSAAITKLEEPFLGTTNFYVMSLDAQYKFANGYILPLDCKLDPYLQAGFGVATDRNQFNGNLGLGLNYWFRDQVGLFAQTTWNAPELQPHFFLHAFGVKLRLGSGEEAEVGEAKISKEEAQKEASNFAKSIQFESGSDKIKSESNNSLDAIAAIMKNAPFLNASVEGHTDNTGDANQNKVLSGKRAQAVVNYLVSKGVELSRLTSAGFGIEKPIATNDTPEGRKENRRVEIKFQ